MNGLTLQERYYKINEALNLFLKSKNVVCPVYKYGVDPATLNTSPNGQDKKYPYFQSFLLNPKPQSWTTQKGGTYFTFEYQLSFFTSPRNEFQNDTIEWKPFELARIAFSDIDIDLLRIKPEGGGDPEPNAATLADVLDVRTMIGFKMTSGAVVPSGVLLIKMAAVVGYPIEITNPTEATNIDDAISISQE